MLLHQAVLVQGWAIRESFLQEVELTSPYLKWSRWLEGRNEILGEESKGRTSERGPSFAEVHKKLSRPIGRPKAQVLHPPGRVLGWFPL